ncbi:bZIP transcription factor [Aspergillus affinis]|uniref:bZIP transcription factor n=1 Tax=Aspergillus affinis TaxID=1070780 RepID=UPI0022FE732F|nr:bZIP transcription factor [Aspergillus affinis]KAI9040575.1 bZIP transcription factor [Aspergillus affinis]
MDDTLFSTDLPGDWTEMLAQFDGSGTGSTTQFESMTSRKGFESNNSFVTQSGQASEQFSYQTTTSQFHESDRIHGVQCLDAGNDEPDLPTLSSNHQDLFSLPITLSTRDQEQPDTSTQPSLAEAHSPFSEPHATFGKSVEVKQLRQKYHEKYKERNRLAAGKSRQKQVDLIALLEAKRLDEERRRRELEDEIRKIQKDLLAIKEELHNHIRVSNYINMMSQGTRLQTLGLLAQGILR